MFSYRMPLEKKALRERSRNLKFLAVSISDAKSAAEWSEMQFSDSDSHWIGYSQCFVVCCIVLQYVAVCCRVAICCSVAVWLSVVSNVLPSGLRCSRETQMAMSLAARSVLQCVAV